MGMAKVESLPCSFGSETIMKTNLVQYLQMLYLIVEFGVCYCWVEEAVIRSRVKRDSVSSKEDMLVATWYSYATLLYASTASLNFDLGLNNDEFQPREVVHES